MGFVFADKGTYTPVYVCAMIPYACLPACIFIGMDRARQNRTTADLLSGLQSAHLLSRGQ